MFHQNTGGAPQPSPWLVQSRPNPAAALRLFCFPFAGGNALIYRNWADGLPRSVELCPVQLPGRGGLLRETPFRHYRDLVPVLTAKLAPHFDKPFAFFGHSMGALIAFEIARRLREESRPGPVHLFASGCPAPQMPDDSPATYDLPEPEFIEELRKLNGTPQEVLDHPELMKLLLPVLRADFELVHTYDFAGGPPLDCPITAFGGVEDERVPREEVEGWREQTAAEFRMLMLPGDHFFIQTATRPLLQIVSETLQRHAPGGPRPRA